MALGRVLREERLLQGLSLERVAEGAGVSRQTVKFVECATYSVRMDTYYRIACGLGLKASEMMARAEEGLACGQC